MVVQLVDWRWWLKEGIPSYPLKMRSYTLLVGRKNKKKNENPLKIQKNRFAPRAHKLPGRFSQLNPARQPDSNLRAERAVCPSDRLASGSERHIQVLQSPGRKKSPVVF